MGIEYPDDVEIVCDGCGKSTFVPLSEYAGDPRTVGVDSESLDAIGWQLAGGDELACNDCVDEDAEEEDDDST